MSWDIINRSSIGPPRVGLNVHSRDKFEILSTRFPVNGTMF